MNLLHKLQQSCRAIGMDRAIAASTATQLVRFLTGPVTMILIIRYLSPEEQGFFYSFAGVLGIQVFLEAGFAQSITQFSSKEFARLRFNRQGVLTGNPDALSRLRSIVQKANRYYALMATVLTCALAVGGYFFFSVKDDHGVPWRTPWFVVSVCAGFSFLLTPIWAVLEGCNRVVDVAAYRFWVTLAGFATSALCLILGFGIQVAAWTSIATLLFPVGYLFTRWRKFITQILRPTSGQQVSWLTDIWGFQWRIALVWMAKYGLEVATVPISFYFFGALEAGRLGLTIRLLSLGGLISTSWTASKIPRWGSSISREDWDTVMPDWRRAGTQHVLISMASQCALLLGILVLLTYVPSMSKRLLSPSEAVGYSMGIVSLSVWLVYSHLARAARQEPYVALTIISSVAYILLIAATPKHYGIGTITWSFGLVHLAAGFYVIKNRLSMLDKINAPRPS